MAEERMKIIFHHINPNSSPTLHAFGVQNPVKAVAYRSNYVTPESSTTNSKKLRYTNNRGRLTYDQRLFYEDNGFIVIPKLVPLDLLEKYKSRFYEICERRVEIPGITIMKELSYCKDNSSEKVIYKLQDFIYDEDVLFEYCKIPQILDYVESFCGSNFKAMHTMLINKPPDSGSLTSRHPLHQDLHYFPFRPADKIVCSWTAMEKVSRANGCLVAIPGTHKGALLQHEYPDWEGGVNKLYHGVVGLGDKIDQRVFLEMDAGDTVFFHPVLIHGSGANRTKGFRKAISCHYAASECDYIDVKGTTQANVAEEILEMAKKRGADIDDTKYIWQVRGRLVRGKEVTL